MKALTRIITLLLAASAPSLGQSQSATSEAASRQYNLVVIGGTPGGIACAVRAARQGLRVLLVNHSPHLGGICSSGLGVADTQYDNGYTGGRSPLLGEWSQRVLTHYRTKYGADSLQYKLAQPGAHEIAGARLKYESRVAEQCFDEMVRAESRIALLKGYHPVAVERAGRVLQAVLLARETGNERLRVAGRIFVDAMYEADLAALAGVDYRVGREAREEYDEPHAGRIFAQTGFAPLQAQLDDLCSIYQYKSGLAAMKAGLHALGISAPTVCAPFATLNEAEFAQVRQTLARLGIRNEVSQHV